MNKARAFILMAAASAFLFAAAWLGRPVDGLWNSPDETANAFWAEQVADGHPLAVRDVFIGLGAGAIHPRSMGVSGDALVPGSFPGLILLFGALKLMLKLPFNLLTPIFTALAGLLFGALVSKLFDRRAGFWAALLFFTHPAILYYGARGLFHNELFLDLLVIAASFFVLRPLKGRFGRGENIDDVLGGFIFSWAIVTRASEAVWAIPAFLVFLPLVRRNRWRRLGYALAGAALPAFIFMSINASLYGSPFRTAYSPMPVEQSISAAASAIPPSDSVSFLPFGFHPRSIVTHLWSYGLEMFWWQSLLAAAGFALWIMGWRKTSAVQRTYAFVAIAAAAWLAVFYGSWTVTDRFDPTMVTIGTSYVRYFLPAYLAALPFGAVALTRISDLLRRPWFAGAAVALGTILAANVAVFSGDESMLAVRLTLEGNAQKKRVLLDMISPEAVVMTERFDKLIVPDRLRIIPATDGPAFAAASMSVSYGLPVYYYGLAPSRAELRLLAATAADEGLALGEPYSPIAGEVLYPLTKP